MIVAFSMNRFLLAGLSAALPHVVERDELVLANAVTPTSGTIAFMVGLGVATGLRRLPCPVDHDVAVIVLAAVGLPRAPPLLALRIPRPPARARLRPPPARASAASSRDVAAGWSPVCGICASASGRARAGRDRRAPVLVRARRRRDDPALPQLLQRPRPTPTPGSPGCRIAVLVIGRRLPRRRRRHAGRDRTG